MKPDFHRLQHQEKTEDQLEQETQHQNTTSQAAEFESVEEMIRLDASQVEVPPEIAIRLNESIAAEPKAEKPWFKKIFSS